MFYALGERPLRGQMVNNFPLNFFGNGAINAFIHPLLPRFASSCVAPVFGWSFVRLTTTMNIVILKTIHRYATKTHHQLP
jgi:hypothetical protein